MVLQKEIFFFENKYDIRDQRVEKPPKNAFEKKNEKKNQNRPISN